MIKRNIKVIIALLLITTLTGCTKYMQYDDKKSVTNDETGQRVVENILCKTSTTDEDYERIKNNKIESLQQEVEDGNLSQEDFNTKIEDLNEKFNIEDIVDCSEFKVSSGGYEGIWTTLFVKTLAFLIVKIGTVTKNYGWAIIIVTILIRLVMYPLTKKTAMQSENIKKAQPKLDKLEQKYRNRTDQQSQMQKSQEMLKIYKDNNISPMAGCLFAFIQIPLFLAFYEALYRLPVILEESFFGIQLGLTPSTAFGNGQYQYIIFVVLVVAATYFSFKLNSTAAMGSDQAKQMKMMTNFSVIMISISSFFVSAGIALYWIFNSGFTIVQNLLVKRRKKNDNIS